MLNSQTRKAKEELLPSLKFSGESAQAACFSAILKRLSCHVAGDLAVIAGLDHRSASARKDTLLVDNSATCIRVGLSTDSRRASRPVFVSEQHAYRQFRVPCMVSQAKGSE